MKKARSWPRTWPEFCLLVQVFGVLTAFRLLLPWVKLRTLVRWLERRRAAPRDDSLTLGRTTQYTDALLWRIPLRLRGPCLPRALTLFYFARRSGLPVQFHCGVQRTGARLQGHAWLSLNGRPFLERDDPHQSYAVIFSSGDPTSAKSGANSPAAAGSQADAADAR
jgi:hypothetical protein